MKKHSAATKCVSIFLTFVMLISSPGTVLAESDLLYEEGYIQAEEASEAAGGDSAQGGYGDGSDDWESYGEPAENVETGYEVAGSDTGDQSSYVENAQEGGSENGSGVDGSTGTVDGSGSDLGTGSASGEDGGSGIDDSIGTDGGIRIDGSTGTDGGSDEDGSSGTGTSGSADGSQTGDGSDFTGASVASPVVTWRSLTVEARPAVLYELYEGENQGTDDFLKVHAIWPYLYNRDLSYELSEQVRNADGTLVLPGGESTYDYSYEADGTLSYEGSYLNLYDTNGETRPLVIEVSGALPGDVTAEAR